MTGRQMSRSRAGRAGLSRLVRAGVARRMTLAALAAFMLLGVAPALASARQYWSLNGTRLTQPTPTKGKGTVKLTDTKVPLGVGSIAVECEDSTEGNVGLAMMGEVTKWTLSKCVAVKGCESTPTVEAVNLPWKAELVATGSGLEEKLLSSGKGTPGFKMSCEALHIRAADTCTASLVQSTTNGTGGVSAAFLASEKLSCTLGGTGSGVLEGSNTIESTSGKLSAERNSLEVAEWLDSGKLMESAMAVKSAGTLAMSDVVPGLAMVGVECNETTGTGSAGAGTVGETSTWTMSGCKGTNGCESAASIQALHLPWITELYEAEGIVREVIVGSKGKPGFEFKCKASGIEVEDECEWVPTTTLTNTLSGVTATLKEAYNGCSEGKGTDGKILGSQAIEFKTGGILSVS